MRKINRLHLFKRWKKSINKDIDNVNIKNVLIEYLDIIYNTYYTHDNRNKKIFKDEENAHSSFKLISEVYLIKSNETKLERIKKELKNKNFKFFFKREMFNYINSLFNNEF